MLIKYTLATLVQIPWFKYTLATLVQIHTCHPGSNTHLPTLVQIHTCQPWYLYMQDNLTHLQDFACFCRTILYGSTPRENLDTLSLIPIQISQVK